ncbi:MAG: hypothetical protein R6U59_06610 [Eubacteriales bacterium]
MKNKSEILSNIISNSILIFVYTVLVLNLFTEDVNSHNFFYFLFTLFGYFILGIFLHFEKIIKIFTKKYEIDIRWLRILFECFIPAIIINYVFLTTLMILPPNLLIFQLLNKGAYIMNFSAVIIGHSLVKNIYLKEKSI